MTTPTPIAIPRVGLTPDQVREAIARAGITVKPGLTKTELHIAERFKPNGIQPPGRKWKSRNNQPKT